MLLKHPFHQPGTIVCQKHGIDYLLFLWCQWVIFWIYICVFSCIYFIYSNTFNHLVEHNLKLLKHCGQLSDVFVTSIECILTYLHQSFPTKIKAFNKTCMLYICFNCKHWFYDLCSLGLIKRGNKVLAPSKDNWVYWVYSL